MNFALSTNIIKITLANPNQNKLKKINQNLSKIICFYCKNKSHYIKKYLNK